MDMDRRQLLQSAAGAVAGAFWWRSGRAPVTGSDGNSSTSDEFDPTVHGFGFANWEGNTGTGADGEEFAYDPGDVTENDVQQAIEESWGTALSEAKEELMTRIVYAWIGGNAATNGHCYGMSFAAAQYFQDSSELPAVVNRASDIPRPTGVFSEVGDRIRRLQTSQLLRAEPYWFALLGMRWGLADHSESIRLLTQSIDASGTAGIALDGESNPHQVLAHGYENENGVTNVFIYDPTYSAAQHDNPDRIWTLSVERETGDVLDIEDGYDTFLYHNPDMDSTVLDRLIGGPERVLEELSDAVFLGLETAGELAIDVPDEVIVDRPTAEYADPERAPYNDSVLVLGSLEGLSVSLDGEAGTEYSLDVFGLREDDLAIEDVVTDVLDEGSTQLQLSVDEAGEFVVDVAEVAEEGAAEAAEEAAEEAEEGVEGAGEAAEEAAETVEDANDGTSWRERVGVLAAAGGAAGLGVVYWLLGKRGGGEPDGS